MSHSKSQIDADEEEKRLYFSIMANDHTSLQQEISQGINVDYRFEGSNQLGKSALHLCCETGNIECAKLLLEGGANVDPVDLWYQTPLMYSVCTERLEMVELLIQYDCSLDEQDRFQKTALHYALGNSETDCMKALIAAGADLDVRDDTGHSPLWKALMEDGCADSVRCLIDANCDVNLPDNRERKTPLQAAILFAKKDCKTYVRMLLEAGAEINTLDMHSHATMMSLIHRGYRQGTSVEQADVEMAQMLLKAGYDVNLAPNKRRYWFQFHGTALKMAVQRGALPLVRVLLEANADPDIPDYNGATPLLYATSANRLAIIKLLLQHNCRLEIAGEVKIDNNLCSVTPFECAVLSKHWEVARYLVWAGCDLRREKYLIHSENIPLTLLENLEFWEWAHEAATNPQTLLEISRDFLRCRLGQPIAQRVGALPLPGKVKDYVLLKDLVG